MANKRLSPKRWFILPKWEDLPDELKTEAVKPYYEALSRHKGGLFFKRVLDVFNALIMLIL